MHGIYHSCHSRVRSKQRSVSDILLYMLFMYGDHRLCRGGASSIYFSRSSLDEIRSELGPDCHKRCEKFRNVYAVVSGDGTLITVARSHRRLFH